MEQPSTGVLVLDNAGQVRFAAGLGSDTSVIDAVTALWRRRSVTPLKRLFALDSSEQPLTVATVSTAQGACFLLFQAAQGDELTEFIASVDFSDDILRHFVTNPFEAVTVVDKEGTLRYISPIHEKFFGLRHGEGAGRPVTEVIENTRLQEVVRTGKGEIGQVQEMNGVTRVVTRTPIFDRSRKCVGAIGQVMFKGPESIERLSSELARVRQELAFYKRELSGIRNRAYGLDQIVGNSDVVRRLKEDIIRVAPLDVPVLLVGESGTGKELVAHAIHLLSSRNDKPLVLVNAAAMPANLVESELFGYEGGAFTGADKKGRKGKFELADTGSLFLDEIGDMPLEMQVKLLRVLQDGTFERVGGDRAKHSDFRLISASNRNFDSMIKEKTFRLDLFYRISAVTLRLPPLRERLDDIPSLAEKFLTDFARRHGVPKKSVSPEVVRHLQTRAWPGNVRQLQHAIERATIFSDGEWLSVESFEGVATDSTSVLSVEHAAMTTAPLANGDVRSAKEKVESDLILEAMERHKGNKKRVAEVLGMSRSYLYKRLKELNMA
ncbi:Fis family transcriptional regulator [Paraburkholderia piptadeniae]|uniref:Fis family transcriptional regulator n=1 Tax=Paraburkholderia piptadeniae TaxID=1701573 RepID=A0A1N7RWD9_9BURK|nr:sigma 54-interacting transcriptional regulator [Paraburkholderia piptadeniae]SIT39425.1 Fis family transcriptional regulator [Paraburkholderia piptadeniae]